MCNECHQDDTNKTQYLSLSRVSRVFLVGESSWAFINPHTCVSELIYLRCRRSHLRISCRSHKILFFMFKALTWIMVRRRRSLMDVMDWTCTTWSRIHCDQIRGTLCLQWKIPRNFEAMKIKSCSAQFTQLFFTERLDHCSKFVQNIDGFINLI